MSEDAATCLLLKEYDPKVKGLYLQKGARGDVWYLYYRTRDGQQRRPKIGDAKVINRTIAREMAAKLLLEVAQGEDPGKPKPVEDSKTMQDLREEYDRLHGTVEVKVSTKETYDILWDKHIVPFFGAKTPIRDIKKADVIRFKSSLRDQPPTFNRASKLLSHAFLLSEDWGWRDEQTNPCYRIKRYKETKRTRLPSPEEFQRVMDTLARWENSNPWFVGLVRLLAYTGARRGEIMKSRREWWQGDKLVLPDSKTGAKIIPISTHAQEIVKKIPEVPGNPYLIVGRKEGTHFTSPRKAWGRLCEEAGVEELNMHDLRRHFASLSISSGQTMEQTMQLMGHSDPKTTKGYAFLLTPEKIAAMQATGDRVMEITQKKAPV